MQKIIQSSKEGLLYLEREHLLRLADGSQSQVSGADLSKWSLVAIKYHLKTLRSGQNILNDLKREGCPVGYSYLDQIELLGQQLGRLGRK